ncbi:MotA/TolQ/ExbB proton channel family protein [Aestuariivirga sp.]|uniref:MotA/TolQ/ExbB proton channel family protein n=1 Tax=Aestuariivirga sp. TaxID=2650926 RepID=UPI0039E5E8E7
MENGTHNITGHLDMFWQADPVVKAIMIGLVLTSLASWAIIIEKSLALGLAARADRSFISRFQNGQSSGPSSSAAARLLGAMTREASGAPWSSLIKDCVEGRFRLVLAEVQRKRRMGLPFLATVASAGPFVGLFGTVWGIMASFTAIAASQNTSLAVVAPGIAEALLATAIGLFAAIPAAVFFNRLTAQVNGSVNILQEFGQEIMIGLTREAALKGSGITLKEAA